MMITEYQINVAAKTVNGADLAAGWVLAILATSKEDVNYRVVAQTCSAQGQPPIKDHYENVPDGVLTYLYDPAADNSKSEDLMLTNNLEANLNTWVGNANWIKL